MDEGFVKSVIQRLRNGPQFDYESIDYLYTYDLMEDAADLLEILCEHIKVLNDNQ